MTDNIQILLSRHFDPLSRFVYLVTGKKYTHISMGLGDNPDTYYSFTARGFRIEKPKRWHLKDSRVITLVYCIEVEKHEFDKVFLYIENMIKNQKQFKYNFSGVIKRIIKIPSHTKKKYFCSQFVAQALMNAGIISDKKDPSFYLPNSLADVLIKSDRVKKIAEL